jgi:hypothetical protein
MGDGLVVQQLDAQFLESEEVGCLFVIKRYKMVRLTVQEKEGTKEDASHTRYASHVLKILERLNT